MADKEKKPAQADKGPKGDKTPKGEKALARCVPHWKEAQGRFEAKVGAGEWRALLGGLAAVSAGAAEA